MTDSATAAMAAFLLMTAAAQANDLSPATCTVSKVTDGDSFVCRMSPPLWGPYAETHVRVAGIDTPESRKPPAKCVKEVRLGKIAASEMKRRVPVGASVVLIWTGEAEKYGRVLARVTLPDGKDWAGEMIRLGFAAPYAGGTKGNWCR